MVPQQGPDRPNLDQRLVDELARLTKVDEGFSDLERAVAGQKDLYVGQHIEPGEAIPSKGRDSGEQVKKSGNHDWAQGLVGPKRHN